MFNKLEVHSVKFEFAIYEKKTKCFNCNKKTVTFDNLIINNTKLQVPNFKYLGSTNNTIEEEIKELSKERKCIMLIYLYSEIN